ncbi:MAG: hypothetical protein P4M09_12915 [Devosia sp.]|nr:hypothetical protein [Devosia sp.]
MSLALLNLTSQSRPIRAWQMTAEQRRRERVIEGLAIQRCLAEADKQEKPLNLRRTVRRANESGGIVEHIVQRRPRRWYWRAESGAYFIQVLYDGEAVALSKGKATVECADIAALIAAMDVLEAATRAGELDVGLAKIAEASRRIKKKAA